jgi:hypothetical protein
MPATRAEFAAQVLKSIAATPRTPKPNSTNLAETESIRHERDCHQSQWHQPQRHQPKSRAIKITGSAPVNRNDNRTRERNSKRTRKSARTKGKYRYQVRLHENMHVTGSEPQWGWTTDP